MELDINARFVKSPLFVIYEIALIDPQFFQILGQHDPETSSKPSIFSYQLLIFREKKRVLLFSKYVLLVDSRVGNSAPLCVRSKFETHDGSMGLVYVPGFTIKSMPNVGKYR